MDYQTAGFLMIGVALVLAVGVVAYYWWTGDML